jgi:hypothetical protein
MKIAEIIPIFKGGNPTDFKIKDGIRRNSPGSLKTNRTHA